MIIFYYYNNSINNVCFGNGNYYWNTNIKKNEMEIIVKNMSGKYAMKGQIMNF
jgi:hypothetical protein